MAFFFYLFASLTILGALGAMLLKNLIRCAMSLILFFLGIAGFFFLLQAEFIAAVQILIYVGAVATLVLFAVMLTRDLIGHAHVFGRNRFWAGGVSILVALLITHAIHHQYFQGPPSPERYTTEDIGNALLTSHVLPFEVVSLLLVGAMIGAIVIALEKKKERKI